MKFQKKFTNIFFDQVDEISKNLDKKKIENLVLKVLKVKKIMEEFSFLELVGVQETALMQLTIFVNFVILNVIHRQIMFQN